MTLCVCALQELSPDQVVALVSCTIWQERAEVGQKVREDMQGPYGALTEAARRVAKVGCWASHVLALLVRYFVTSSMQRYILGLL